MIRKNQLLDMMLDLSADMEYLDDRLSDLEKAVSKLQKKPKGSSEKKDEPKRGRGRPRKQS